jgi:hypothetical protein
MLREFEIKTAENGGCIVLDNYYVTPGQFPKMVGAFSTPADMIAWLAEQFGVKEVPEPVKVTVTVGEWDPGVFDEIAKKESTLTVTEPEWTEHDGQGCPFADLGTRVEVRRRDGEHVKASAREIRRWLWKGKDSETDVVAYRAVPTESAWTDWDGSFMDKPSHNAPCMIRMRNGSERAGKTWDNPRRWNWAPNVGQSDFDVIAYRLV